MAVTEFVLGDVFDRIVLANVCREALGATRSNSASIHFCAGGIGFLRGDVLYQETELPYRGKKYPAHSVANMLVADLWDLG